MPSCVRVGKGSLCVAEKSYMVPVYNARATFFHREHNAALNTVAAEYVSRKRTSAHPPQQRRTTQQGINTLFDKHRSAQFQNASQQAVDLKRQEFLSNLAPKRSCGWDRGRVQRDVQVLHCNKSTSNKQGNIYLASRFLLHPSFWDLLLFIIAVVFLDLTS